MVRILEIDREMAYVTPSMSIRFGAFFGQSDTFWHGIQVECDFRALAKDRKKLAAGIKPVKAD